jgi:hypothetical protein
LETREIINRDEGDKGVQLLLGLLILVSLSVQANTDSGGDVLDALAPDELVQGSVNSDIGSLHHLLSELLDHTDSARSTVLERDTVKQLAHVNRALSGDDIRLGLSLSLFGLSHFLIRDTSSATKNMCQSMSKRTAHTLKQLPKAAPKEATERQAKDAESGERSDGDRRRPQRTTHPAPGDTLGWWW